MKELYHKDTGVLREKTVYTEKSFPNVVSIWKNQIQKLYADLGLYKAGKAGESARDKTLKKIVEKCYPDVVQELKSKTALGDVERFRGTTPAGGLKEGKREGEEGGGRRGRERRGNGSYPPPTKQAPPRRRRRRRR